MEDGDDSGSKNREGDGGWKDVGNEGWPKVDRKKVEDQESVAKKGQSEVNVHEGGFLNSKMFEINDQDTCNIVFYTNNNNNKCNNPRENVLCVSAQEGGVGPDGLENWDVAKIKLGSWRS